jgi:hypothetical protein
MTKQLEVIQQKDAIKDSVTEAQKNDVDNFIKAFEADKKKGESKPEQIINIFDKTGKIILENMYANFKIKKEDKTIKRNDFNDPTVITFNTAILAFEKDLAEYNSKIKSGGNILSDDVAIVNKFKAELQVQSTATTNAEQDKQNTIDVLGKHYETQAEVSNGIFEWNYEWYTSMMTLLYNGSTSTDNNTKKIEGTTTDEKTFIELFNLYALGNRTGIKNGNNTINISDIKIGRWKDFTDARFNESNERVIQYQETKVEETPNTDGTIKKTETKETKHFVRWEDKDLQKVVADKSIPKTVDAEGKEHYDISQFSTVDRTSKEKGINTFDDQGNYEAFGRFLEAKWVEYTKANFSTITSQILDYKPTEW